MGLRLALIPKIYQYPFIWRNNDVSMTLLTLVIFVENRLQIFQILAKKKKKS